MVVRMGWVEWAGEEDRKGREGKWGGGLKQEKERGREEGRGMEGRRTGLLGSTVFFAPNHHRHKREG